MFVLSLERAAPRPRRRPLLRQSPDLVLPRQKPRHRRCQCWSTEHWHTYAGAIITQQRIARLPDNGLTPCTKHVLSRLLQPSFSHISKYVCRGCLLHTDPQERAKTTIASSGCRPRPTAPDPGVSHGKSQVQATAGLTNAGEATGTPHRSTRAQARNREVR